MDEASIQLDELKRDVTDLRAQQIKLLNLTSSIGAELRLTGGLLSDQKRQMTLRTALATAAAAIVALLLIKLAWEARIEAVRSETLAAEERSGRLEAQVASLESRAARRQSATNAATAFLELMNAGKKAEMIEAFEALQREDLSPVERSLFTASVLEARAQLSLRAYHVGLEHQRAGRSTEAAAALEESISLMKGSQHEPLARVHLGRVYRKLGRQRDAVTLLLPVTEAAPDKDLLAEATMLLADCYVDLASVSDARSLLRAFLRRSPAGSAALDAREKLHELTKTE